MIVHNHPSLPGPGTSLPVPKASGLKVDVHVIMLALRRHWRWAFFLGLVFATAGTIGMCMLVQPKYRASATIQIRSQVPYVAFEPKYTEQTVSKYFAQTQIELLRSPIVLEPATHRPDVAAILRSQKQANPVQWLSDGLSVQGIGKSELFTISFISTSPTVSETVTNAIIDEYFDIQKEGENLRSQRVIDLLTDETKRRQQEVMDMRNELKQLVDQAAQDGASLMSLFTSNNSVTSLLNPGNELLTRLTDAEVELEILEAQVQAEQQATSNVTISQKELGERIASNSEIQRLQGRIQTLQGTLHETERLTAGGLNSPHCQAILKEINELKTLERSYASTLAARHKKQLELEVSNQNQSLLQSKQAELESRRLMVELLRQRHADQLAQLRKDNNETLEIEFRRAELLQAESVLERISNRAVALRTEQRAPDRVILRQRARTPLHPVSSYPLKEILIAMVVGFAIPIGLAVLIETIRPKVNSGESLQRNVHLNVLGEVARLPARSVRAKSKSLRCNRQPLLFEESVDALRTNLFLSQWGQSKIFAITSAVNAEGKTSIATQLALSVSRMRNVKTLLIDCDLRIPELHNYFDISLGPGLIDTLTGRLPPEETVVETWLENLDVLPAGQLTTNPHSLFTAEAMERVLHWAASKYNYIILDTPPVLEASEALVAAKAADASILCTMQNVSRFDQIRKACERLTVVGSPPIGAILSGVTYRHGKYSYRYQDSTTTRHTTEISV